MSAKLKQLMSSVERYLSCAVVPILQDYPDLGLDQIGSATILEHSNKLYLLTAKHTFDDVPDEQIKIPDNPHGPGLIHLWPFDKIVSGDGGDDVIVFRLNDACASLVRKGWTVIPTSRCGDLNLTEDHAVAVSGYPSRSGVRSGEMVGGTLLTTYTDPLAEPPAEAKKPVRPEFDLFLNHGTHGTKADGTSMDSPRMYGVSGAAIWDIHLPPKVDDFRPGRDLRLVGVQTDTRHASYIRGLNWEIVRQRLLPKF